MTPEYGPLSALLILLGFFFVIGLALAGLAAIIHGIEWLDDRANERRQRLVDERQGLRRKK